jgi:tetratricopeptide (TPR) repeat protein
VAGDAARDKRDWNAAVRHYEIALENNADAIHIAVQLGHAYKERGDYEQAGQQYYRVLEITPDDDDLHLQIGYFESLRENFADALAHYQRSLELNPGNADARREIDVLRSRSSAKSQRMLIAARPAWLDVPVQFASASRPDFLVRAQSHADDLAKKLD